MNPLTPHRTLSLVVLGATLVLSGCGSSAKTGLGGAAGAAVFSLKLAYCKNFESKSDSECLLNATAAGVAAYLAASIYGDTIDKRREQYADTLDYYDAERARMAQLSNELESTRTALAPEIRKAEAELERVKVATADATERRAELSATRESLLEDKAKVDEQLTAARDEFDLQQDQLRIAKLDAPDETVDDLEREIAVLEEEIASLAGVSSELAALSSSML